MAENRSKLLTVGFILLFSFSSQASIIYNGKNPSQVALTFDDGPSFKYTGKVLDILKKENVKATFFVVGNKVAFWPEILEREVKEGHEIGNHTYYHSRITELNDNILIEELDMTSRLVKKLTGKKLVYFRPPHGTFTKSERVLVEKAGYKLVLYSVHADDFYHLGWGMRSARSIEKRVIRLVTGGDIILAHDDSEQIVKALPVIIETLKKKGYHFVTLSEMLKS